MDRLRTQPLCIFLALVALSAGLTTSTGCSLVATAMYVIQGANTKADFDGLKGKRVAVVCRPITSLHFRDASVARDLGKQVGLLLEKNVDKIEIIDQREVFEWGDENDWEEYVEIGKALNADMVVGLDLEEFNLYQGQTLYQGKANLKMLIFDVAKGANRSLNATCRSRSIRPTRPFRPVKSPRPSSAASLSATWRGRLPTISTTTTRRSTSPTTARRCWIRRLLNSREFYSRYPAGGACDSFRRRARS